MKKTALIFALILGVIITGCSVSDNSDTPTAEDLDRQAAIEAAMALFRSEQQAGTDLTDGPCLSESVTEGWALDIIADSESANNNEANQCSGDTEHLVELTVNGQLVQAL